MTPIPNEVTFPINLDLLAGGLVASDAEVREAMRFAFEQYRIVAEPGAAVGLAAVLSGRIDIRGKTGRHGRHRRQHRPRAILRPPERIA